MSEKIRAFIAIHVEASVLAELEKIQRSLAAKAKDVRWTRSEQLHLTLKFLGYVLPEPLHDLTLKLNAIAAETTGLSLTAEGLGCFPNFNRPRIIWAGLSGDIDRLSALQSRVDAAAETIGIPREERPFHPHLTLGRVAETNSRQLKTIGHAVETEPVARIDDWRVREMHLMQSVLSPKGATYRQLAAFSFR
jgi:RNA 2',3'-cyclic 3'-phosphodiesterase